MDHKTVEDYILSMPSARLDYPFGEGVAVYKVSIPAKPIALHFDAAQGGGEELTEPYIKSTVKVAPEPANTAMRERQSDGKMFAIISEHKKPLQISLKCDPQLAITLREKYETVLEGYHLNKKHWNTIILSGQLPWEELQGLILHSYNLVASN